MVFWVHMLHTGETHSSEVAFIFGVRVASLVLFFYVAFIRFRIWVLEDVYLWLTILYHECGPKEFFGCFNSSNRHRFLFFRRTPMLIYVIFYSDWISRWSFSFLLDLWSVMLFTYSQESSFRMPWFDRTSVRRLSFSPFACILLRTDMVLNRVRRLLVWLVIIPTKIGNTWRFKR